MTGAGTSRGPSPEAPAPNPSTIPAIPLSEDDGDESDIGQVHLSSDSTTSVSSSILQYRTIQGRTFHSEKHNTRYFTPNDDQNCESLDIAHHYLTLLLGGKLYLAPITDDVQRVVDIGTGTGIWAIDFAEAHPSAEVTGTDLSPIQPSWVPSNLKFEIDDATQPWTWTEDTFDFVHMRYLTGAIPDWPWLLKQAYRCCKPHGWVESADIDPYIVSDDGTTQIDPIFKTWSTLFREGEKQTGRSFSLIQDGLQRRAMEEAGFGSIEVINYKLPIGSWPKDPKLAEIGQFVRLALITDIEGYTMFLWNTVLGWPKDEYQLFLLSMRKALWNKRIHGYLTVRFVFGRKTGGEA